MKIKVWMAPSNMVFLELHIVHTKWILLHGELVREVQDVRHSMYRYNTESQNCRA